MSKIKIKNFGPIKEGYEESDGWLDVKKVTLFIGNQGSGKSTIAKVISTLTWLEKAINRGDVDKNRISHSMFHEFFAYQRINNYFKENTSIEYKGNKMSLKYNLKLKFPEIVIRGSKDYVVPKIMYVPAERNILVTVKNAYGLKELPDTLYTFAEELRKGQLGLNDELLELPISEFKFKYDKDNETSYIVGDDFELDILESSSGYQSSVPLFLVTKFLSDGLQKEEKELRNQLNVKQSVRRNKQIAEVMFNDSLTDNEKSIKVKEIDSKYINTCLINIVEEPEQNLFPSSQHRILNSLLKYNNLNSSSKLIMTTHSPYLINYLTLSVEADYLKTKIQDDQLLQKLNGIVPLNSTINPNDLVIYELDEKDGTIKLLGNYKGLPSDENKLNDALGEGNESFAKLLEFEQKL